MWYHYFEKRQTVFLSLIFNRKKIQFLVEIFNEIWIFFFSAIHESHPSAELESFERIFWKQLHRNLICLIADLKNMWSVGILCKNTSFNHMQTQKIQIFIKNFQFNKVFHTHTHIYTKIICALGKKIKTFSVIT